MHSVRRRARMVASSQGGDGSVNYNPFARTRNREHIKDAENPVYSIRSEPPQNLATGSGTCPVHSPQSSDFSLSTQSQATLETYGFNFVPIASVPSGMHNEKSTAPEITKSAPLLTSAICGSNTVTNRAKLKAIFSKAQTNELDDSELTHAKPDELTLEERNKQSLKRYIPIGSQIKTVLLYNWVATILLPCIAIGFTVNYIHANAVVVFCINFAAIIPSATALSVALNEIHIRSGEKTSALLNQTFGNAVQLILSIFLLKSRQVSVLKLSLLGTVLSSLLLTTGLCFLLGGYSRMEQNFNKSLAQMICMLLLLGVSSHAIPTTARWMTMEEGIASEGILAESRGISVIILISYGLWLFFTLSTHRELFDAPPPKASKRLHRNLKEGEAIRGIAAIGAGSAAASGGGVNVKTLFKNPNQKHEDNYKEEESSDQCTLSLTGAIITLIVSVVLLAFNTQFATDSIQAILQRRKVSQAFLSMIILPLLSIDPVAINAAMADKMDICISLALERCMQTCLLVVPLIVLLAWCMGVDDMDLNFDGFSIATLFVSVLIVTYVVRHGKSNWFTGVLLIKVFIIIALAAFYTPESPELEQEAVERLITRIQNTTDRTSIDSLKYT